MALYTGPEGVASIGIEAGTFNINEIGLFEIPDDAVAAIVGLGIALIPVSEEDAARLAVEADAKAKAEAERLAAEAEAKAEAKKKPRKEPAPEGGA